MINTSEQKLQEQEYTIPYHYLDFRCRVYNILYRDYFCKINIVSNLIKPFNGQKILDAGCGDGRFCYEIGKSNVNVEGVDFSARAIEFAKIINPKVSFYQSDLADFHSNTKYSHIVCMEVIEHIPQEELPDIIDNFNSLLEEKGLLIITVPSDNIPVEQKHFQHFNITKLQDLLSEKFVVETIEGFIDIKSFKAKYYYVLKQLELLFISVNSVKLPLFRFIRYLYRLYSRYVVSYFTRKIINCKSENSSILIATVRKK